MSRRHLRAVALLLCLPFLFLFSRFEIPAQSRNCLHLVSIASAGRFVFYCDSQSLTSQMDNLEGYLETPNPWRSRPLYLAAATGTAYALSPVAALLGGFVGRHLSGDISIGYVVRHFSGYLGLQALSFVFLGLALSLMVRLSGGRGSALAAAAAATVATSELVHGMFWSQHPSFFNVLVPLAGILFFVYGCRAGRMSLATAAGLGGVALAGLFIYAFAVIWLPAFVLGALFWQWRTPRETRARPLRLLMVFSVFAAVSCLPYIAWDFAVTALTRVSVLGFEAADQFTWVTRAHSEGNLETAMLERWHDFFPSVFLWIGWPGAVAILGIAALAWKRLTPGRLLRDPIIMGALVTAVAMLGFNYFQGFYQPRLVTSIASALLAAMARTAQLSGRAMPGTILLTLVAAGQLLNAFLEPAITTT
jgi:hypothetical protein